MATPISTARGEPGVAVPAGGGHVGYQPSLRRSWTFVVLAGAGALTLVDGILLQEKKSFFTGGFLAGTYARSPSEGVGFLLMSFVADAAVLAVAVIIALWACSRVALTGPARLLAALLGGCAPLLIANFLQYGLWSYLGDAFDLGLMFELTGRRPSEILAVSSSHLVAPALLITGGASAAWVIVTAVNRWSRRARRERLSPSKGLAAVAAAWAAAGLVSTAVARNAFDLVEDGLRRKPSGQVLGWFATSLTDVDGDGYGVVGPMPDPRPFDASVYPYALEIPGNGIDENGVGGDLPHASPAYTEQPTTTAWRHRPDVVLIVLESFRADVVGRIVNGRSVTPVLDAIAASGASTQLAFSHNGYTVQSRFHIFSGSLADLRGGRTLVDDFRSQGYEVAYFSSQDESFGGPAFRVGFDRADVAYDARQDRSRRYSTFSTAGSLAVPHAVLHERLSGFLGARDTERPLFLYLNFHDTHYPYHHDGIERIVAGDVLRESEIAPARRAALRAMYDNTAANVDRAIGRALHEIEQRLGRSPAVIVTADHGESLFDEGFLGHGYALNDVQTRIPLIVSGLPIVIAEPFGQAELRNAIADALAAIGSGAPSVRRSESKGVFQYLGTIQRPREIAWRTPERRIVYNFRDRRVVVDDAWYRPEQLTGETRQTVGDLIHTWERMMLARSAANVEPE